LFEEKPGFQNLTRPSGVASTAEFRLGGVASTAEFQLGGVASTAEFRLGGVASTAESPTKANNTAKK